MKTVTVKFIGVGRNDRSWTVSTDAVSRKWMVDQVRNNAQVMSRDLEFDAGFIFAGWRQIGTYRVEGGKTL